MKKVLLYFLLERPVRALSYDQLADKLRVSGSDLQAKWVQATHSPKNHRVLTHIIGIERWGQCRLRVALGDSLVVDEYDGYRPNRDAAWPELIILLRQTRAETVALLQEIGRTSLDPNFTVVHNQFGPISLKAWARYLWMHAQLESKRVK